MEIDFSEESTKREVKTTKFQPKWALNGFEELADMPNIGYPYDPTNGASDIGREILDRIEFAYCDPLGDESLRDDEMKGAILRNLKVLLFEAIEQLENDGY
jgi:hypothetical protein